MLRAGMMRWLVGETLRESRIVNVDSPTFFVYLSERCRGKVGKLPDGYLG